MDCSLLLRGAPPGLGTTHAMSKGDSEGTEEKETRNPSWISGEEQEDGKEVGIQTLSSHDRYGECTFTLKRNG